MGHIFIDRVKISEAEQHSQADADKQAQLRQIESKLYGEISSWKIFAHEEMQKQKLMQLNSQGGDVELRSEYEQAKRALK